MIYLFGTIAIICLTIIEFYALSKGINGTALAAGLSLLGACAGLAGKKAYDQFKNKK